MTDLDDQKLTMASWMLMVRDVLRKFAADLKNMKKVVWSGWSACGNRSDPWRAKIHKRKGLTKQHRNEIEIK